MKLNKTLTGLNDLLGAAAKAKAELAACEAQYQADVEALKKRHEAYLKTEKDTLAKAEKALVAFAKAHLPEIFGEADRCDVPNGAVLRQIVTWVVKARSVTPEILEAAGYAEAVKIAKSVDWDRISAWPDEKLVDIGTERKRKEEITWETVRS